MLRLHDTAVGKVRDVEFRDPGRASLYVCGPTVYDNPHLGHGRYALVFDVLRRHLLFSGFEVDFVSNITDIDDKIIERADREERSEAAVAEQYEGSWWEAMDALGVLRPTENPHATAYVAAMVAFVGRLLDAGVAYELSDGVYLEVASVADYGLLARQPLDSLRAGARVEVVEEKRSPLDFALWKRAKDGEPSWDAPFGSGRPGWHTECVVMSLDLLGAGFDIHGGGQDLAFPHHENERAQAVASGQTFASHWVHNGWVMVEGEKMSKSLGNFTSLTDLLARSDARAYRLLVLRAHYRSPIEVTLDTIADAEKGLARLDALARRFDLPDVLVGGPLIGPAPTTTSDAVGAYMAAMDDDLDTAGAMAGIFDLATRAHTLADAGEEATAETVAATAGVLAGALGLSLRRGGHEIDEESAALAAARDEARDAKDWSRADSLRDDLAGRGWIVEDGPLGTTLRR